MLGSLFNKVAGLETCSFSKKRLQHRCFPVNIVKLLRAPILKNICKRLLLCGYCDMDIPLEWFCYFIWVTPQVKCFVSPHWLTYCQHPTRLVDGISYLWKTWLIELNIPTAVENILRHVSRNMVQETWYRVSFFPGFGDCFHQCTRCGKITSPGSLKLGIRFDSPVLSECYLYLSTQRSVQNFFTLTVKQLGMWEDLWQYTKAMRNTENRRRLMYYQLGKNNPKVYRIIANIKKTLNVAIFLPKPSFGVFTVHGLLFCLRTYWFPLEIVESEGASLTSGPVMSTVAMMR